jgi:Protein of unknown function (DUF1593)
MSTQKREGVAVLDLRSRIGALGVALALILAVGAGSASAHGGDRPRTIVTTDPELDDLNSMIRFLLYSNEVRVEGLVYSSSQHHWSGDATRPPKRWKAGQSHIEDALDVYERVYGNLRRHDRGYPSPARLRSRYRVGNIVYEGDMAASTPGARLIADVLLDDEPGPVFLQAWGGTNTIARALKDIEERYAGTPKWPRIHEKVSRKAIITRFAAQDSTYADYIAPVWPGIENRDVATTTWGYFTRNALQPEDAELVAPEWTRANVSDVGPFGELYRVWGDGKFMAEGFDNEDFFGFDTTLPENSREALIARGYFVWSPLYPPGAFISEGDSSNFALLVDNGLRSHESATYGGWGGRQVQSPANPHLYAPPAATAGDVKPGTTERPRDYATARWWRAIQMDFAARLRWSVTPHRSDVNHEPTAWVPQLNIKVRPGERVRLRGAHWDADGDRTTARWWQYPEAGTYPGTVELRSGASFTVPADAQRGQTIHLIYEVTDDGSPALTSYQRVIATVR